MPTARHQAAGRSDGAPLRLARATRQRVRHVSTVRRSVASVDTGDGVPETGVRSEVSGLLVVPLRATPSVSEARVGLLTEGCLSV